jgi:hypothetical protein
MSPPFGRDFMRQHYAGDDPRAWDRMAVERAKVAFVAGPKVRTTPAGHALSYRTRLRKIKYWRRGKSSFPLSFQTTAEILVRRIELGDAFVRVDFDGR